MRERLKRVVLKTTVRETVPGVRIPLPPPYLSAPDESTACIPAARKHVPSPMRYRNEKVSFGGAGSREYERFIVLEERVRALREATSEIVTD